MSRVGYKKIVVPAGVTVKVAPSDLWIRGPKGEIRRSVPKTLAVAMGDGVLTITRTSEDRLVRSLHGMTRSHIQNMVTGVSDGYEKILEISGVGFRAAVQGRQLNLSLGYSHPVLFDLPVGIDVVVEKQTVISIKGVDKSLVGQVASTLRALKKPEPYKGKGIKYRDEKIVRKKGKTGK